MEPSLKLKWKDVILVSTRKAGEGSYGIVYECFEEGSPKKKYAVKCIQLRGAEKSALTSKEYEISRSLSHRAVVNVYDLLVVKDTAYIIMDLCDTDLGRLISTKLTPKEIWAIMVDVTSGLRYMQAMNVVHRDLKPENILMQVGRAKITDFGVSKMNGPLQTNVGTPVYQAPEVGLDNSGYDGRCDSFSLGIILYEMCYRTKPFRTNNFAALYEDKSRLKDRPVDLPKEPQINEAFRDIILGTLVYDPQKRMTISDIYYRLKNDNSLESSGSLSGSNSDINGPPKNGIRVKTVLSK